MAALPFLIYSTIVLLGNWSHYLFLLEHGLFESELATFMILMGVTSSYGLFCGVCIWFLGVYRNSWFCIEQLGHAKAP